MHGGVRFILYAILLVSSCNVSAQNDAPIPASQIPTPATDVPSAIQPSEPPTGYTAPASQAAESQSESMTLEGNVRVELDDAGKPRRATASGPVALSYKDLSVTADNGGEVDFATNQAVFFGNIIFRIDGQEATLKSLTVNLKTKEWSGSDATITINPRFARGYLEAPVFASGQSISGKGKAELGVFSTDSTTCDLDQPHYHFAAASITVYPDDRIVMKNVTMYALGKKVFSLPRFTIPVKEIQRNQSLIPKIGQTAEEGYFIKTACPYLATQSQTGTLLLDIMTRKGIGKGIHHTWRFGTSSGVAELYHIYDNNLDQNTLTGRVSHSQTLGTCRVNLSSDFRSNSYVYAPASKSLLNQISVGRNRQGANTLFSLSQSINDAFSRSVSISGKLHHTQQFGSKTVLDTGFDYTSFDWADQPTRARLQTDVLLSRRENSFDWSLSTVRFTDLSDEAFIEQSGFAGLEKRPEFGISTDSSRLKRTFFGIPATLRLNFGEYVELPASIERSRVFFALDTPTRTRSLSSTWSLTTGAGFKQYAYSDDTAQYSYDIGAQLSKKLGATSTVNLTYRCQQPKGFTPFRYDYIGRYNVINGSLDLRDNRKFRASLLTGYNFEQTSFPWQDMVLRMSIEPSDNFLFYTATGYDFNRGQWRTLINQFRIRSKGDFKLDIGTRYDPVNKRLATARAHLAAPMGKKTRIEVRAGYNGFAKSFDYRGVAVTRDLHCWEATIAYVDQAGFYSNKGFTFSLRIKAFPFFKDLGVGPFGQWEDTSVGQVY